MSHLPATKCTTAGPPVSSDRVVLRASAVVTTAYVTTSIDDAIALGWQVAIFRVHLSSGDATTFEFKAQSSADGGVTWDDLSFKDVPASGLAPIAPDQMRYTPAATSTAYNFALPPCDVVGHPLVRLLPKYTGGSGTGVVEVSVSFGLVPVLE